MLLTLATQQPRMLLTIVQHTPSWVWMLLAALIWLGASQFFARSAGLRRVLLMPVAMTVFSVWGLGSAFGALPQLPAILGAWLVAACAVAALSLWLHRTAPTGTRYDATLRRFELPGSGWPLLLILGIFLVKWAATSPCRSHWCMACSTACLQPAPGGCCDWPKPVHLHQKTSSLPERPCHGPHLL